MSVGVVDNEKESGEVQNNDTEKTGERQTNQSAPPLPQT